MAKHLKITVEGKVYDVVVEDVTEDAGSSLYPQPGLTTAAIPTTTPAPTAPAPAAAPVRTAAGAKDVTAPMGGVILEVNVKVGDPVKAGQQVALIEAMKMKSAIVSDHDGKVTNIMVKAGDAVDSGQALVTIE